MGFLFILSNITIPLLFLSYRSLIRSHHEGTVGYGQIFVFVVFTLFSNLLFYVFSKSFIFLIIDFAIKLGIVFMPQSINSILEKQISYLHLQILFEKVRSHLIQKFYLLHEFITDWAITKMDEVEEKQFKNTIMQQLQKTGNTPRDKEKTKGFADQLQKSYKHYENIGIQCSLLTAQMIQSAEKQSLKDRKKLQKYLSQLKFENKFTPTKDESSEKKQVIKEEEVNMKKKGSFLMQKSSTDLFEEEQDSKQTSKSFKMPEQKQIKKKKSRQSQYSRRHTEDIKPHKQSSVLSSQPSMILNKLDVSQYSDMFQDEIAESQERKLVSKIEAIIQIGHSSSVRLQIYNIELYTNDDIRIVSLYGRQFERHKLISMKEKKHGYYELELSGGKVEKRRVKFRGKIDAFAKFLTDK